MAVTYRIDSDDRIVYLTTTGESSFEEWREVMLRVLADPSHEPGLNFLSDRRLAADLLTTDFVTAVVEFLVAHREKVGPCRWAGVSDHPVGYGMHRMLSVLAQRAGIMGEAFKGYEEARCWLLTPAKRIPAS